MREVVISKREWVRQSKGRNWGNSVLRQKETHCNGPIVRQCCLGFVARACGFTPEEIEGVGTLLGLTDAHPDRAKDLGGLNPEEDTGMRLHTEMIMVNDNRALTDREKIAALKSLGRVAGFQLMFVP